MGSSLEEKAESCASVAEAVGNMLNAARTPMAYSRAANLETGQRVIVAVTDRRPAEVADNAQTRAIITKRGARALWLTVAALAIIGTPQNIWAKLAISSVNQYTYHTSRTVEYAQDEFNIMV